MQHLTTETIYEDIAQVCHEANRAYCQTLGDDSQVPWSEAPEWQKESSIKGVQNVADNPEITASEIHQSWMDQKIEDGWARGKVKNSEMKIHPSLVPFEELSPEEQNKDKLFVEIVKVLLPEP